MYPALATSIASLPIQNITSDRKIILLQVIEYLRQKRLENNPIKLNFICTHNSRRSQLAQIWAQAAADYYKIEALCYSGGVEVTEFNERAVNEIKKAGFIVRKEGIDNPTYLVSYSEICHSVKAFSKLYDDPLNPSKGFAAIMTCADADEKCPFILGAEVRIPLLYNDPKEFDGNSHEAAKYEERSRQIGAEMFYIFSQIK